MYGFQRDLEVEFSKLGARKIESSGTPSAGAGTLTTASHSVKGRLLLNHFDATVTITIEDNGTGSGFIQATMPFAAREKTTVSGTDFGVTGVTAPSALCGYVEGTNLVVVRYDGTYPGDDDRTLSVRVAYQI